MERTITSKQIFVDGIMGAESLYLPTEDLDGKTALEVLADQFGTITYAKMTQSAKSAKADYYIYRLGNQ